MRVPGDFQGDYLQKNHKNRLEKIANADIVRVTAFRNPTRKPIMNFQSTSIEAFDLGVLKVCYIQAQQYSRDKSSRNCAMIGDRIERKIITSAENSFAGDHFPSPERYHAPLKYLYTEHAERLAIYNAANLGVSTRGLTMWCPWAACADCARAIALSGITCLVRHEIEGHDRPEQWLESIEAGDQILKESGVNVITYTQKIDPTDRLCILRRGLILHP